jgi:hypothetical protein
MLTPLSDAAALPKNAQERSQPRQSGEDRSERLSVEAETDRSRPAPLGLASALERAAHAVSIQFN